MLSLAVNNLNVSYDNTLVLNNLNFELTQGELIAVIGPNGSGKTTLLRSILGIKSISDGSILINNCPPKKAVSKFKGMITYLPQHHHVNLLLPLTVYNVVAQGLTSISLFGRLREEQHQLIIDALETVKLTHKKDELFMNLSGGQRQRALLAFAIVNKPQLLFLDEPTSALDTKSIDQMYQILAELKKEMGIMIVSHDISKIVSSADKVMVLMNKIKYFGRPHDMDEMILHKIFGAHIKMTPDPNCAECEENLQGTSY